MAEERARALDLLAATLRLEEPAELDARCVGVAFMVFSRTVDLDLEAPEHAPSGETADAFAAGIQSHLEEWESLAPEELAARWRDFASDPYIGVGPSWVGIIDQDAVERWLASDDLAEAKRTHPPYTPRRVTLSNLQVVALGPARAVATYRVAEEYQNGAVSAGNTFAVLMHVAGGWRIAVASKGTRHEAPLRE